MSHLLKARGLIDGILHKGGERANDIARHYLAELHDIVGILRP
jgi:hypothetical protein